MENFLIAMASIFIGTMLIILSATAFPGKEKERVQRMKKLKKKVTRKPVANKALIAELKRLEKRGRY